MKHPLPKGWVWARCHDVIDVRDGTHDTPKKVESGIPMVTSKNLKPYGIDFDDVTYISEEDYEAIEKRSGVDDGDILFAMIGTIGNPVLVKKDRPFSIKNVALFKIDELNVHAAFFKFMLDSPVITKQLDANSRGGNQKFVSLSSLRNMQIPLPPLPEQKRIAAILDKADSIRRKRQDAVRLTEELLRSVFLEMFGDPVTNPKGWEEAALTDVAEIVSGVTKGRNLDGKQTVLAPYLRVANVQDGYLNLNEIKEIEVLPTDIEKYRLLDGDILLTEGGDPDKLGRGTVWREHVEDCIHQNHIFRVRIKTDTLLPDFLSVLIGSERGKRYFLRAAKQTTGIASINSTQLKSFPVLLPSLDLQQRFAKSVVSTQKLKNRLIETETTTNALFNSLLLRAFMGEL